MNFESKHVEPETLPISYFDYASAINALNYAKIWVPKNILLLQSLWRVQNGLEIGIGPERNSVDRNGQSSYYGNMIKDGESNGRISIQ